MSNLNLTELLSEAGQICDRLLDSEEHAGDDAIPEVAEDAADLINKLAERFDLTTKFMQELLDSVETLTGIADLYGARTLSDLLYLHSAILSGGFIDHYPGESKVLEIARCLPSGEQWVKFIKVEYMAEAA